MPPLKPENIPQELRALKQWVCWWYKPKPGSAKPTKIPYTLDPHVPAKSDTPSTWSTFEAALEAWEAWGFDGIGFMFSAEDPYCGIDLDNIQEAGIEDEALRWVAKFDSYAERSVSGKGIHIISKARLPGKGKKKDPFEIFDRGRFFCFTGEVIHPGPIQEAQEIAEQFYRDKFGRSSQADAPTAPEASTGSPAVIWEEGVVKRHDKLVIAAGYLRALGMGEDDILSNLFKLNQANCHPPKPEEELRKIARDAAGWAPGTAREQA